MVDALFETQETWAVTGGDAKEKLLQIARQAGISKEEFDQCLADKELFSKIVETARDRANEKFQVDSTPTFFINGKRLKGDHSSRISRSRSASARPDRCGSSRSLSDRASHKTEGSPAPGQ